MGIALFSSLGLPGLNGFIGEFLIFKGSFPLTAWATSLSVLGLLVTAIFILGILQRVFSGPLNPKWVTFPDLTSGERLALAPAIALMFALGLYPQLILGVVNSTVIQMVQHLRLLINSFDRGISHVGLDNLHLVSRSSRPAPAAQRQHRRRRASSRCSPQSPASPSRWPPLSITAPARCSPSSAVPWIPSLGIEYHLAADGISLTLVLLTGIIAVTGVLFSWNIQERAKEFFAFYLLLIGAVYGVFLSFDLFLLFVFYEIVIIPKYFLIAIWGSTRREYGAMKLAIYSFVGSAMVLVGLIAAYVEAGAHTTSLSDLAAVPILARTSRWRPSPSSSSASPSSPACGPSTPGRPPATSPRPPLPPCCSPASS